jgi:predicted phage-related endonuclease
MRSNITIGGSFIASIAGLSRWQTPLEAWEVLTGRRTVPETWQMRRGTVLQSEILKWWARDKGVVVKSENVHIQGEPAFLVGDLDGIVSKGGEDYVVEVKSSLYADEPSDEWVCQVIWYEGLSGIQKGYIVIDTGREIKDFAVAFDAELFDLLKATAIDFYERYIIPDIPPPASNPSEKLQVAISKIKANNVPALPANEALLRAGEQWLAVERTIRKRLEALEELKGQVADFMAQHGVLKIVAPTWEISLVEREGAISWKQVAMELGARERPELLEKYRGKPSRYIVIKEHKEKEV